LLPLHHSAPHTPCPLRVVAEFLAAASPLLLLLYRLFAARRSSSSSSSSTAWWPRAAPPSVWVARARRLSSSLVSNPRRIPLSREPVWCPARSAHFFPSLSVAGFVCQAVPQRPRDPTRTSICGWVGFSWWRSSASILRSQWCSAVEHLGAQLS